MQTLTLLRPDDMHLHLRDGDTLRHVLPHTARQMGRAVIMPNLKPPVISVADALAYRERILASLPAGSRFQPLMTLYLTDHATPALVQEAKAAGIVAFKLYPAGATTNSDSGVTDLFKLLPVLEEIAAQDMRFLVHGEVTDPAIDIFDREAAFIERILLPVLNKVPGLKTVFEHITTAEAARLVCQSGENLAASVTPQHLLLNRNDLLVGGVHPHHYCLPVLKRESHRQALLEAVSGAQAHKFFLGTDSAPHPQHAKENACGCAGMFSAATAIELYAEAFEQIGALDKLEAFASKNGARFYGLPENTDTITLVKQAQTVPNSFPIGSGGNLVPMRAGGSVAWTMQA
ncbi:MULTISPECIES: dihydroorotase [Eikenella]|uniref:Dihydroorotase n=2 Tax=Eikenella corrodens TaxID=539 RepID=A0A1A9R9Y4_EIKCO|nr:MULTISPECIES: dihydroorotase [Eikenella]EEG24995.1 dihydroorotase, homodimeric type [Eikenella corrodens ATCC 23834]MDU4300771.1 dihydroorotase [Eikenella corrodens]OAM14871.1 dihydroorotase [Eikenella corrodens]OAM15005.1 dihydroorotase [Eikenella corrodens]OAM32715.1 dihydroorotase [Eikenella corrodens]